MTDFTKKFFQEAGGKDGYYETFSYELGIEAADHRDIIIHLKKSYNESSIKRFNNY